VGETRRTAGEDEEREQSMVTMRFTLDEEWKADDGKRDSHYDGEALFWACPARGHRQDIAAHVYQSLGKWEWYVFTPTDHGAFTQGKADKRGGREGAGTRRAPWARRRADRLDVGDATAGGAGHPRRLRVLQHAR